jgi:hypothetical protein
MSSGDRFYLEKFLFSELDIIYNDLLANDSTCEKEDREGVSSLTLVCFGTIAAIKVNAYDCLKNLVPKKISMSYTKTTSL